MADGFTVDLTAFENDLERFAKQVGRRLGPVREKHMGSWAKDLMKRFPPSKALTSARLMEGGDVPSGDRRLGRESVTRDINKVFVKLDKQDVLKFFASQFGNQPAGIGKKVRKNLSNILPGVEFNWTGDLARMRKWHDARRHRGTIAKSYRSHTVAQIQDWTFVSEMYVPSVAFNRYLRIRIKEVGKLKGGWTRGVERFSGRGVPGWLSAHRGGGTATGQAGDDGRGDLSVHNRVGYNAKYRGIVNHTVRNQRIALIKRAQAEMNTTVREENAKA